MLPSSTVENYLKAIYQGQIALPADERLVPMGQVAATLSVTPGTATTIATGGVIPRGADDGQAALGVRPRGVRAVHRRRADRRR